MSAQTKHTAGSWAVRRLVGGQYAIVCEDGVWLATTSKRESHEEESANARLIAEAFNVAHQSGRSPAELLADVESLRAEVGFLTECREALKLDKAQLLAERDEAVAPCVTSARIAMAVGKSLQLNPSQNWRRHHEPTWIDRRANCRMAGGV